MKKTHNFSVEISICNENDASPTESKDLVKLIKNQSSIKDYIIRGVLREAYNIYNLDSIDPGYFLRVKVKKVR